MQSTASRLCVSQMFDRGNVESSELRVGVIQTHRSHNYPIFHRPLLDVHIGFNSTTVTRNRPYTTKQGLRLKYLIYSERPKNTEQLSLVTPQATTAFQPTAGRGCKLMPRAPLPATVETNDDGLAMLQHSIRL